MVHPENKLRKETDTFKLKNPRAVPNQHVKFTFRTEILQNKHEKYRYGSQKILSLQPEGLWKFNEEKTRVRRRSDLVKKKHPISTYWEGI